MLQAGVRAADQTAANVRVAAARGSSGKESGQEPGDARRTPPADAIRGDRVNDGFGHWLAGFIDGEGCFLIAYRKDRGNWLCQFRIRVRADDADIVQEIHARTGIGRYFLHAQASACPLACWEVSSRSDCAALVELLDQYPLRAKKARDFEIWRRAVATWQTALRGRLGERKAYQNVEVWREMESLGHELREQRRYQEAVPC